MAGIVVRLLVLMQQMKSTVSRALELHRNGNLVEALELYNVALKEKRPECSVFLNASSILRGNEQQKEAVKCLKQGLELYPKEPGLWNNLGNSYMDLGNTIQAIHAYRRALSIDAGLRDPLLSLILCLRSRLPTFIICSNKKRFEEGEAIGDRKSLLLPLVESIMAIYSSDNNTINADQMTEILKKVELEINSDIDEDPCRANLLMTQLWIQVKDLDNAIISRESF